MKNFNITKSSWQKFYGILFIILFLIEVIIALFVKDQFIRPYLGDVLVVLLVYCFIRMIIPLSCRFLPLYVTTFAVGIEILQYFHFLQLVGLSQYRLFRLVFGSTFDIQDILCYLVGGIILVLWQKVIAKKHLTN